MGAKCLYGAGGHWPKPKHSKSYHRNPTFYDVGPQLRTLCGMKVSGLQGFRVPFFDPQNSTAHLEKDHERDPNLDNYPHGGLWYVLGVVGLETPARRVEPHS